MALVKCPECGRENVSDTAETCPSCGFNIKKHYDTVRAQQIQQKIHEIKLEQVKMPEEPKKMNLNFGLSIFFLFGALCGFLIESFVLALLMIMCACWMYFEGSKQYENAMEKYNLAKTDFEKYKKEIVRNQEYQERMKEPQLKCPICGSTSVKKISTANRVASTAMVGIASGKIGKQYKCGKCGHMW